MQSPPRRRVAGGTESPFVSAFQYQLEAAREAAPRPGLPVNRQELPEGSSKVWRTATDPYDRRDDRIELCPVPGALLERRPVPFDHHQEHLIEDVLTGAYTRGVLDELSEVDGRHRVYPAAESGDRADVVPAICAFSSRRSRPVSTLPCRSASITPPAR